MCSSCRPSNVPSLKCAAIVMWCGQYCSKSQQHGGAFYFSSYTTKVFLSSMRRIQVEIQCRTFRPGSLCQLNIQDQDKDLAVVALCNVFQPMLHTQLRTSFLLPLSCSYESLPGMAYAVLFLFLVRTQDRTTVVLWMYCTVCPVRAEGVCHVYFHCCEKPCCCVPSAEPVCVCRHGCVWSSPAGRRVHQLQAWVVPVCVAETVSSYVVGALSTLYLAVTVHMYYVYVCYIRLQL